VDFAGLAAFGDYAVTGSTSHVCIQSADQHRATDVLEHPALLCSRHCSARDAPSSEVLLTCQLIGIGPALQAQRCYAFRRCNGGMGRLPKQQSQRTMEINPADMLGQRDVVADSGTVRLTPDHSALIGPSDAVRQLRRGGLDAECPGL